MNFRLLFVCLLFAPFAWVELFTTGPFATAQDTGRFARTSEGFVVGESKYVTGKKMILVHLNPELAQRMTQVRFEQLSRMGYAFDDPNGILDKFAATANARGGGTKTSDPNKADFKNWAKATPSDEWVTSISTGPNLFGGETTSQPDPFKPSALESKVTGIEVEQEEMRGVIRELRKQVGTMETNIDDKLSEQTRKIADMNANISAAVSRLVKIADLQKMSQQQTAWERQRLSKQLGNDKPADINDAELSAFKKRIALTGKRGYLVVGQTPSTNNTWESEATRWNYPIMFAATAEDTTGSQIPSGVWQVWQENGGFVRAPYQQVSRQAVVQPQRRVVQQQRVFVQPQRQQAMFGGGGGFSSGGG